MKKRNLFLAFFSLWLGLQALATTAIQAVGTEPNLNAQSAIAVDAASGQILYQKNPMALLEVGNLTKLLSLLIIYDALDQEKIHLDDRVTLSDEAYALSQNYEISNVPLRQDLDYSVAELLEAVEIGSANGALLALAEYTAGSKAAFQDLMQAKVQSILVDSDKINEVDRAEWLALVPELTNLTGLVEQEEGVASKQQNKLNAIILAAVSYQLVSRHPELLDNIKIDAKLFRQGTDDQFEMHNSNQMLAGQAYEYDQVDGLMSAATAHDGYGTVQTMARDNFRVIVLTLGNSESSQSYHDSKKLLDYVYGTYQLKRVISTGDSVTQINQLLAHDGEPEQVQAYYGENLDLAIPIVDTTPRIDYLFEPDTSLVSAIDNGWNIQAPQAGGQTIGQVQASIKQHAMQFLPTSKTNRVSVKLSHDIKEAGFMAKFWRGLGRFFSGLAEGIRQFFIRLFN